MITETGKSIMVKYLLGQVNQYATHIALGCGTKPLLPSEMTFTAIYKQTALVSSLYIGTLVLEEPEAADLLEGDFITVSNIDSNFDGVHEIVATGTTTVGPTTYITISYVVVYNSQTSPAAALGTVTRNFKYKENLDFEMFRVPITSRGHVHDTDGSSKLVFTANMPISDRYEITEIGLYPAESDTTTSNNSRNVFNFTSPEGWSYTDSSLTLDQATIPTVFGKLDPVTSGTIAPTEASSTSYKCFMASSSNITLNTNIRVSRQERCRFMGNSIFLRGDTSDINSSFAVASGGAFISLPTTSPNSFNVSSPIDELRLAFSIVSTVESSTGESGASQIGKVRIVVKFSGVSSSTASMNIELDGSTIDFSKNRYFVKTLQFQDLVKSATFNWSDITTASVYVSVLDTTSPTAVPLDDYYICLDGLRLENLTTKSSTYGLTGYAPVINSTIVEGFGEFPKPIIKQENIPSFVEFRYSLDVT